MRRQAEQIKSKIFWHTKNHLNENNRKFVFVWNVVIRVNYL